MDILNNVYILVMKNKHLIPTGALLLINAIIKTDRKQMYLGDNIPLGLIEKIKRSR